MLMYICVNRAIAQIIKYIYDGNCTAAQVELLQISTSFNIYLNVKALLLYE